MELEMSSRAGRTPTNSPGGALILNCPSEGSRLTRRNATHVVSGTAYAKPMASSPWSKSTVPRSEGLKRNPEQRCVLLLTQTDALTKLTNLAHVIAGSTVPLLLRVVKRSSACVAMDHAIQVSDYGKGAIT